MPDNDNIPLNHDTEAARKTRPRQFAEVSPELMFYYEKVENNPVMSEEEEKNSFEEICGLIVTIRRELSKFLFVLDEHEKLIEECKTPGCVPTCFCTSELSEDQRADFNLIFRALPGWRDEIRTLRADLAAAYRDANCTEQRRQALQNRSYELLGRYPAAREKIEEWCQVVKAYIGRNATYLPDGLRLTDREDEDHAGYRAILDAQNRYYDLREKFVNANLRLVLAHVQKYNFRSQQLPDLIQEGNLGLMQAFDRFDFRVGTKFSTYATWWIRRNIVASAYSQARVINIPVHMYQTIALIRRTEEQIFMHKGADVTVEELAAELRMPVARIHAIKMMMAQPISLQTTLNGDEEGRTPEDFLCDDESASPSCAMDRKVLAEEVQKALSILNERELVIIRGLFGLDGCNPMGTQQLADMFGVTRLKIRQIERYALQKLKRITGDLYREIR